MQIFRPRRPLEQDDESKPVTIFAPPPPLISTRVALAAITALALLLALSLSSAARAAEQSESVTSENTGRIYHHELTGGTDSTFSFAGGTTSLGIAAGYRYYLLPDFGLQIGYDTNFQYQTAAGNGVTTWSNFFGVRYNLYWLGQKMPDQFFVDLGVGFQLDHSSFGDMSASNTDFLFRVGAGKRFGLFDNVAYVPQLSETHVANQGWTLSIVPIAVSVLFG